MSENRESGPSVTGVLPNATSFVRRANDVLSQNITDAEKEQLLRQLLGSQVTGDSYTVPQQQVTEPVTFVEADAEHGGHREQKPRHHRPKHPRDEWSNRDEWSRWNNRGHRGHRGHRGREDPRGHKRDECQRNDVTVSDIIDTFTSALSPLGLIERPTNLFQPSLGRGRRFIGPFDLMEPSFFGTSRLQHDVSKMFDDDFHEMEQECKLENENENEEELSKHLKFTSKLVSVGADGIKRSRVVNGVTKIGRDGKPVTHKKMISSDETGKTITEVFADGTERTTKRPFIKGKDSDDDNI
jgi:hypothetical protein